MIRVAAAAKQVAQHYDFGGTTFCLRSTDKEFLQLASRRYGEFAVEQGADFDLSYQVISEAPSREAEILASFEITPRFEVQGESLVLEGPGFTASVDFTQRRAEFCGPRSSYPIDLSLRHILSRLHPIPLVVHGATLEAGGRAWWMTGPSGCGKSTLAGLLPEFALCDELSAVRLGSDSVRLHSLPFWHGRQGFGELQGIFVIEHGLENRRVRLPATKAVQTLTEQIVWPLGDLEATTRCFELLVDLAARVPVWRLPFRPTREVWDLIEKAA